MTNEQCPDDYDAKISRMSLNASAPFAPFCLSFIGRLNVNLERVSLTAKERRKQKRQEGQNRQNQLSCSARVPFAYGTDVFSTS
jgi:hypothetical protein